MKAVTNFRKPSQKVLLNTNSSYFLPQYRIVYKISAQHFNNTCWKLYKPCSRYDPLWRTNKFDVHSVSYHGCCDSFENPPTLLNDSFYKALKLIFKKLVPTFLPAWLNVAFLSFRLTITGIKTWGSKFFAEAARPQIYKYNNHTNFKKGASFTFTTTH